MPDNSDPVIAPSLLEIEAFSEKEDYHNLLDKFETVALSALSEPGVSDHLRLDKEPPPEFQHLKGRAIKAVHALSSVRALRKWQSEAELEGDTNAERFYHIAHKAFIAAMTAAMIAPMVSQLEATEAYVSKGRSKGRETRNERLARRDRAIMLALAALWAEGARYCTLGAWSDAIAKANPELAPSKNQTFARLNLKVSEFGNVLFGDDWPI